MGKGGNWYTILLVVILVASIILLILENIPGITGDVSLTGYLTEGSTYSNVSISYFLAIQMSPNLTAGIDFGTVYSTNFLDQNASKNWCNPFNSSCANASSTDFNVTLYYVNVSTDSNTNVDFCVGSTGPLTAGTDTIELGNETYSTNVTLTNLTQPSEGSQTALTTSYVTAATNISIGDADYWRFFLDIPGGQPAGSYNNLVWFRGVQTGNGCGSGP